MSEWQPIETAPKDGTTVLLYCQGSFLPGPAPFMQAGAWGFWHSGNPNHQRDCWIADEPVDPTHWMPLPEPPE